jgi:hypothetical protein
MSTPQEAPALIQYACERCKTRFVLPPSRRKLSLGGKLRSLSIGLNRTFRYHEGLGSSYDAARRQMLAKMDDEAYQAFVQSFRFCHECRQFVCNECWSTSRRSCLTCVAKSMTGTARPRLPFAPSGPEIPRPVIAAAAPTRGGRVRRDAALVALGLALVLLVVEGGYLLGAGGSGQTAAVVTASPSATPSATPSASPTAIPTPTAEPTATPTPVPTPVPTAILTASPTATPTATPVPTPTRKPATPVPAATTVPDPVISCSQTSIAPGGSITCTWKHWAGAVDSPTWFVAPNGLGDPTAVSSPDLSGYVINLPGDYTITLRAQRGGVSYFSNPVAVHVTS